MNSLHFRNISVVAFSALSLLLTGCFDEGFKTGPSAQTETLSPFAKPSYNWDISSWSACSATACGTQGVQSRTVVCRKNQSLSVADSFCLASSPKPTTSQVCSAPACQTTTTLAAFTMTSGPTVSNLTANSATITWSLSAPATGQIQYGLSSSYGNLSTPETSFQFSTHIQTISGLAAGSTYHFRVISQNSLGQQVVSINRTFSTLPLSTTTTTTTLPPTTTTTQPPVTTTTVPTSFNWVTGYNTTPEPNIGLPSLNVPYTDPSYRLKITRVSTPSMVTDTSIPSMLRHEYARRPAFNSDSTKALMVGGGSLRLMAVDKVGNRMSVVRSLSVSASAEPNWSPTDPNVFYYLSGKRIMSYNVSTFTSTVARDLSQKLPFGSSDAMITTGGEGRPSNDGRIWCLMVQNSSTHYGFVAYNFATDQVVGSFATSSAPNNISTSPKGTYCVPAWGSSQGGIRAYNLSFSSYKQLHSTTSHSDIALTASGVEVLVIGDYVSGYVVMIELATGTRTTLFKIWVNNATTSMHLSGVNSSKPGYAVISMFNCRENGGECSSAQWYKNKVIAIELKANPIIYNLAHTHSVYASITDTSTQYWSAPHAVPNRDLTKILFSTTWGGTQRSDISDYMISVPPLP